MSIAELVKNICIHRRDFGKHYVQTYYSLNDVLKDYSRTEYVVSAEGKEA